MKTNFRIRCRMQAIAGCLGTWLAWSALAQPASIIYDPAGNPIAIAAAGSAPPSLVSPPEAQLMTSNSVASFSVVATGSGLSYQWLSNGIPIVGATGDTLLVGNLPLIGTNLGNFSVIISNASGVITSTPAALWSDSNGNGMPDWWELKYFGNLNQPALGDYDGDGVDNLDEYLEGTDPANPKSFDPRLNIEAGHGSVFVSPDLPYYTMGQLVTLTAVPEPGQGFVEWTGSAHGTKTSISLFMNTNEYVTATFGYSLAEALDNTNLVWTTSGDELWFGEADVSEDGASAAQSGPIVSYWNGNDFVGDQTSLQTTFYISQPEQLAFWWNVSSQPPDGVTFSINGNGVASLSGTSAPWQQFQTNLPAGLYALVWTYSKGPVNIPNGIPYLDAAWVDEVTLTPLGTTSAEPVLSVQTAGANAVLLYWPLPPVVFRLEQTEALDPPAWTAATNSVSLVNGVNQVLVAPAAGSLFYRLIYP